MVVSLVLGSRSDLSYAFENLDEKEAEEEEEVGSEEEGKVYHRHSNPHKCRLSVLCF